MLYAQPPKSSRIETAEREGNALFLYSEKGRYRILPMTEAGLHVIVKDEIIWKIYAGRDCSYTLYEDSGDGYGYEAGEYTLTTYSWSQESGRLTDENGTEIPADVLSRTSSEA